jgi:dolichyl-phosphate beta-glucosyltransferase
MLDDTVIYLEQVKNENPRFTYEILVVDDGSLDDTSDVAIAFGARNMHADLRVLTLEKNRKKGGAVTQVCCLACYATGKGDSRLLRSRD